MGRQAHEWHCVGCGALTDPEAVGPCRYCHVPKVPFGTPPPSTAVRCPSCHGAAGGHDKFCRHCGASLVDVSGVESRLPCPECGFDRAPPLTMWISEHEGSTRVLSACRRCGGAWVDARTVADLVAHHDVPPDDPSRGLPKTRRLAKEAPVRYRTCPACDAMMRRSNFDTISGIILDICIEHGAFFDAGELEDLLAFLRSGGRHRERKPSLADRAGVERKLGVRKEERQPEKVFDSEAWARHAEREGPVVLGEFTAWSAAWLGTLFREDR